jgi:hypothetical protein
MPEMAGNGRDRQCVGEPEELPPTTGEAGEICTLLIMGQRRYAGSCTIGCR